MKKTLSFFALICVLTGCNPKVTTQIVKSLPETDKYQGVEVIELNQEVPKNVEIIGRVKVGDTGFTMTSNCTYYAVVEKAKEEARKMGGNMIKITEHKLPGMSTCHSITALVLHMGNTDTQLFLSENPKEIMTKPSTTRDTNYAILNIYRFNERGGVFSPSYNLNLGDSVICRVKRDYKKTVKIKSSGSTTLWAQTETKSEIPITLEQGKTYYVRCGTRGGIQVGRPTIELVDNETGKYQFESFTAKNNEDTLQMTIPTVSDPNENLISSSNNSSVQSSDNSYQQEYILSTPKKRETENPKTYFSITAGYSHRTAPIAKNIPINYIEHFEKLTNGINIGGDFNYYFSDFFGLGAKCLVFKSSDTRNIRGTRLLYNDYYHNNADFNISDTHIMPFIGLQFSTRFTGIEHKNVFLMNYGLGYMGYIDKGSEDNHSYEINGKTAGIVLDIDYSHWFSKHVALDLRISAVVGTLSKLYYEKSSIAPPQEIRLDKEKREGLGRLDFSIGVRFGK